MNDRRRPILQRPLRPVEAQNLMSQRHVRQLSSFQLAALYVGLLAGVALHR